MEKVFIKIKILYYFLFFKIKYKKDEGNYLTKKIIPNLFKLILLMPYIILIKGIRGLKDEYEEIYFYYHEYITPGKARLTFKDKIIVYKIFAIYRY